MPQSQTGALEHRQIKDMHKSQNTRNKSFSSLYLSESIAKLIMTQYKRLLPPSKNKKISEYDQEIPQYQTSDKPIAP